MPYVNLNGQLIQVTQEQFDIYTIGQNINAATATTQTSAANIAAGGTVTQSDSTTSTILTPNTTNTSPGQILQTISQQTVTTATSPTTGIPTTTTTTVPVSQLNTPSSAVAAELSLAPGETIVSASQVNRSATPINAGATVQTFDDGSTLTTNADGTVSSTPALSGAGSAAGASGTSNIQGLIQNAQNQQTIANQRKQINNGDWRVRLRLAPQSTYLYNAPNPGILQPLQVTDGIIFPYTPTISTTYRATYSPYDVTHSNYRGYFYQNSYVDAINLTATFTAQDTNDANYLLAVIQFLRSATKMFYGQDAERGSPPPVVYLSGFGDYQFREHACVISQFQYNLPADVDYIRAGSPNNVGLNLTSIRDRQSVATNSIFGSLNRLAAAFLTKGAVSNPPAPPTLGLNRPTYVPTKMEIQLSMLPIQSRNQVSQQFSVKEFANGNLLKGGFW